MTLTRAPHRCFAGLAALLVAALGAASCAPGLIGSGDDDADFHGTEGPPDAVVPRSSPGTVESAAGSGCSTASVMGLSRQIAREVGCSSPGALVELQEGGGIEFVGSAVLPYVSAAGLAALRAAAAGRTIQVTSAYRSVAQQYVIRRWYEQGRCSISAAARPGRSNHESGRALDISNYGSVSSALHAQGWRQTVSGDPVHFEHLQSADLRGSDVLAFQRLWNRNHPEDIIAEDGDYGPQTAARLAQAPAAGFAVGACTSAPAAPPADSPADSPADDPSADPSGGAPADPAPADPAPASGCGALTFQGECQGTTLRWCEGGEIRAYDCGDIALECGWRDSSTGYDCLTPESTPTTPTPAPADPCGGLDYAGECQGDVVRWCEDGAVQAADCASGGKVCAWRSDVGAYDCVAPSTPAPADPCGGLDYTGECQGDVVRWCEDGTPRSADCGAAGMTCGWSSGPGVYDCI